jgi:hypothetical protein
MILEKFTASKEVTAALNDLSKAAELKGYDLVRVEIHSEKEFSAKPYTQLGTRTYPWSLVELPASVHLLGNDRFSVVTPPKSKEK